MRGLAFFYADYARIVLTYVLLALSAGAATYLLFGLKKDAIRLIAGIALLANLGFIAYGGSLWSRDMQRRLQDATMAPMESTKIGIIVAPANQDAAEIAEARDTEQEVRELLRYTGLGGAIAVRETYPISSEEQARSVGERLRANIVLWKSIHGDDRTVERRHVTVLGAKEMDLELDPVSLMLLMATQRTVTVQTIRPATEAMPSSEEYLSRLSHRRRLCFTGPPATPGGRRAIPIRSCRPATCPRPHSARCTIAWASPCCTPSDRTWQRRNWRGPTNWGAAPTPGSSWELPPLMQAHWQDALDAFNQARALDPYDPAPYCGLGILAAREASVSRAISSYQQAIALEPDGSVPYALLGMAYELEAKIELARQAYQTSAVQAGPNYGLYTVVSKRAEEIVRNPPTAVPTATLIPIPTPTPVPTSAIYYVDKGDTLKAIAEEFGITVEELIETNQIEDPNAIRVGQKLIIPKK